VGLEPSCTLALRDEVPALLASAAANRVAQNVLTFEELLIRDKPDLQLRKTGGKALLHGHCHQKAFDVVRPIETVLRELAGFDVEQIETSCCGMAGAFGYGTDTYDISMKMGSAQLFPKVKDADVDVVVIADGTSCRCQIFDGTGRLAQHVAAVLADRL
jgi:Fe-S oxidoreductase